ncbi:hypothetical protein QTH97_33655 [Variovorax sp. J22R24]|uniref:hypothetical protein n=1 Tax=Variovorax gracilis TaxID=3053502 RepID=UPI0025769E23|nr:hypothetical protein [Variovorax sp. J22R24]MDM0109899.1 hypothetical protein [Variovorax sp. J22R24]
MQAYEAFVQRALAHPSPRYPVFYGHQMPAGEFIAGSNEAYTVTEVEILHPLSVEEEQIVSRWYSELIARAQVGPTLRQSTILSS